MRKLMLLVALLTGCSANYSDGFRMGTVRKFSKKGIIYKSWEGELLLGGVVSTGGKTPQLVNEIWQFSIDPYRQHGEDVDEIVRQITAAMESGKLTKIHYIENTLPKIRTETDYMAQKAEIMK